MTFGLMSYDHERLLVYQKASAFFGLAAHCADRFPGKWAGLADQLRRAALSITLNISEGAGESARGDKVRFYRIARRSAAECAAAIDAAKSLKIIDPAKAKQAELLLKEVSSMLTGLITSPKVGIPPKP
jgi:four helix bundle protein